MKRVPHGIILLDSLVAIVIFSIGILGMVALQAASTQQAGDARLRHAAGFLADDLIAHMWVANPSTLAADYAGADGKGGAAYMAWAARIDCTRSIAPQPCLPGATAYPPAITVDATLRATVVLQWATPQDETPHQYVSITDLAR
jgi:type IV pilus assembly protein PilV